MVESFTTTFIDKRCPNEPHWTPRRSPPSSLLVFVFIKDVASAHTLGRPVLAALFHSCPRAWGNLRASCPEARAPSASCAHMRAGPCAPACILLRFPRPRHARRPSSFRFTRPGPPVPLPPSPSVSHTHARPLQQVDPVVTCATPILLMQHSDETLATYIRIS